MNEMPIRPTHDVMSIGHVITNPSQGGHYSNQITNNNNNNFVVEFIVLVYIGMSIYLMDFPRRLLNCDLND